MSYPVSQAPGGGYSHQNAYNVYAFDVRMASGTKLTLVAQQAEAALVAVTADAIKRGAVYRSTAADAAQWVQRLSTGEAASALLGAETATVSGPLVPIDEPATDSAEGSDDGSTEDDGLWRSGIEPSHASRIRKLTRGTATLVVTIDFAVLAGILAGLGITDTGIGITPDTVRQLACDAKIISMILGSNNQPLNVGRKRRLVEDELRRAVIHRDTHCTYAGCDRPPVMCEVHHVESWWQGGETSLENSALLCSTHHRIVHRDQLTATVTDTGVTWHYEATGTKVA